MFEQNSSGFKSFIFKTSSFETNVDNCETQDRHFLISTKSFIFISICQHLLLHIHLGNLRTMIDIGRLDLSCRNLGPLMNDAAKSSGGFSSRAHALESGWLVWARVALRQASSLQEYTPVTIAMPRRCADPAVGRCLIFPRLGGTGCKSNL